MLYSTFMGSSRLVMYLSSVLLYIVCILSSKHCAVDSRATPSKLHLVPMLIRYPPEPTSNSNAYLEVWFPAKTIESHTTQGLEGQTSVRFRLLNFGPLGPAVNSACPKIDFSFLGWSSPHWPLKLIHATGVLSSPAVKASVSTS